MTQMNLIVVGGGVGLIVLAIAWNLLVVRNR